MGDNWTETTLGEVAVWYSGGTPKAGKPEFYENGTIPWVVIADMLETEIFNTASRITPAGLDEIGGKLAPKDSVLISMYATVGRPGYTNLPVATNQAIAWSIPNNEIIHSRFLLLVAQYLEPTISSMARGATQKNINRAMLREFSFRLPPLSEQERIVDVMSAVDAYIAALRQQAADARTMRKAVLYALLTPGRAEWTVRTPNVRRFEEMAHLKRGHDLPIQSRKDGEYAVIASNGIVDHHHSNEGPIPGVITGRSGTIGKVFYTESGYWPLNTTLYVTDFMGNVERFVALTLEVMQLENFAGGTTVPSLDRKVFRQELVYVPNVSEQTQIVATVSALDKVIQSTDQAVFGAKKLRSGLLSGLLSGDHEIPETYDRLLGAA
jgi:type I restriction enzyme S subunit